MEKYSLENYTEISYENILSRGIRPILLGGGERFLKKYLLS